VVRGGRQGRMEGGGDGVGRSRRVYSTLSGVGGGGLGGGGGGEGKEEEEEEEEEEAAAG